MARNRLQFDINAKDKTKRAFGTLKRGLKGVSKAIFNMKTGLAAVAGIAGLGLLVRNSLVSIDKIGKLSRQIFISTEELSAFRLAANLGGTSLEAFAKGARTMAVGINDWLVKGTGIAQDAFIQLGISQEDLRATNGDLMLQFELVADALRNMKDGTDKTAAAYKLFGGRNIELLTAIERGKDGIKEIAEEARRFGLVLTTEMVTAVEDANDSITRTKSLFTGVSNHFTVALAPAITEVSDALRNKLLMHVEKTHGSMAAFGEYLGKKLLVSLFSIAKAFVQVGTVAVNTAIGVSNLGIALQNIGMTLMFWKNWDKDYIKFQNFVEVNQTYIDTLELMAMSLQQVKNAHEETSGGVIKTSNAIQKATTRQITAIDTFHKRMEEQVHEERRFDLARLRSVEETEKAKKALRAKAQLDIANNLEGTLTILSGNSKKMFKMLQAHKIAEAIVNTYSAVMKAFSTYPPPWSYAAAGSALAFGMAQVGQIRSQKFTARRQGGAVSENKPYMVGEGGPETFIPNSAGYIAPGVGGRNVNVNFTINAVDTTGFQQLLANERGMIVGMINSAVNQQGKSDII